MNNREIGAYYEAKACDYLISLGMTIVDKNYRIRSGEIDIVARDKSVLVFAEVKYRHSAKAGTALEAIDYRKRKQIIRISLNYMYKNRIPIHSQIRFDCIGFDGDKISYIRNAFDISGSVN